MKKKVLNLKKPKQERQESLNFQKKTSKKRKLSDSSQDSEFSPSLKKVRFDNLANLSQGLMRLRKPGFYQRSSNGMRNENSLQEKMDKNLQNTPLSQFEINPQNLILDSKECRAIECGAGGDCLFKSVCFLIKRPEDEHRTLRKDAVKYIKDNQENFIEFFTQGEDFEDYLSKMNQEGTWGGDYEIQALSCVLQRHILVFQPAYNEEEYEIMFYELRNQYGKSSYSPEEALYLLYIPHELHYQALVFKSNQEEDERLKQNEDQDRYVLFNESSDRYNEMYEFLKNSTLPDRFSKCDSSKLLKKKKEWKTKLVGRYFIDEDSGRLMREKDVKYPLLPKKQKRPDWDPYVKFYKGKFKIPFEKEIPLILEEAHKFHESKDKMCKEISRMGYFWDHVKKCCTDFIANCSICRERRKSLKKKAT